MESSVLSKGQVGTENTVGNDGESPARVGVESRSQFAGC